MAQEQPGFPGYGRDGGVRREDVWWGEGRVENDSRVRVVLSSVATRLAFQVLKTGLEHEQESDNYKVLIN